MIPRKASDEEAQYWAAVDQQATGHGVTMVRTVLGGPEEGDDVIPCPTLITCLSGPDLTPFTWRVAYDLNEIELAQLAQGGTLWLATWSTLPVHLLAAAP